MSKSAILAALEEFRRSISASIDQLTVELHHSSYGFPRYTSPSPSWSPFPPDLSFNSQPTLLPPPPRSEPPPPSMFQPPLPQTPPPTIPPQPTEAAPPETLLLPATPTSPLRLQTAPSVADDPSCRGEEEVVRGGEEVWFDSAAGFDGCAGFVEFLFAGQPVWLCGEPPPFEGGGPAPKADEPAPHPPKDQLPNVSFCITSPPPWPEAILLGFQHYLAMLGTTVIIPTALVPQMGGGNEEKAKVIQTLLFVSGLNTLLQTWFGTRLPVVIGGSYTFVAPTISIILSGRWNDSDPVSRIKKIMRATQSALIVASTIQIVLGFSDLWRNVAIFLSSIPAVPLVALAGFGLYDFGFPGVAKCVEIGLPLLIVIVPYPFQWGAPSFDAGEAFAMMMAAVEQSLFPNHMKRELGTSQGGLELFKKLYELRGEFAVSFQARA